MPSTTAPKKSPTALKISNKEIIADYKVACLSRESSLLGRKEVLTGKAKFGIFGAGKEVPQIALAKAFKNGDFRAGYYRDQTWMLAAGLVTVQQIFAQLYADASLERDPHSAGRQMNAHFASKSIDKNGQWVDLTAQKNTSADLSSTAAQMARAVGLAMASKKYRSVKELRSLTGFSKNGNEICFASIGDASTSEGVFWEAVNAAGVTKIPLLISVWDDGYGISVPTKYQTTKGSISKALAGFQINEQGEGFEIINVKGWDYLALVQTYQDVCKRMRKSHTPALIHVSELTQPQGHSTSGSHERYKDKKRLKWEQEHDCIVKMGEWMVDSGKASWAELEEIKLTARKEVREAKTAAWNEYSSAIEGALKAASEIIGALGDAPEIAELRTKFSRVVNPARFEVLEFGKEALFLTRERGDDEARLALKAYVRSIETDFNRLYDSHQDNETSTSALKQAIIDPEYNDSSANLNGYQIINKCFEKAFARDSRLIAFGEDLGMIGDVNQGFAGLQEIYGEERIFDTGIREATIMGQGIGLAMRGLRPIAEIQYLDYFIYGLQPLTDDLAPLQYRTYGQQRAPLIVRTRGHRLEGIWHAGSPLGMILNALRGIHLCVPRNMVQAAGMYNTLLLGEDPAVVIESLNGYRLKEKMPENIGEFTVPLGVPEVLVEGKDVTVLTYGSCVREAEKACKKLKQVGIEVELIDVQTLLPFDRNHLCLHSVKKTNRIVFMDEDVPGGASAYMMQEVLEKQKAYFHLDSAPVTLTAKCHRTAYGSDGDYFTKPTAQDLFEKVYELMHESDPEKYPLFY